MNMVTLFGRYQGVFDNRLFVNINNENFDIPVIINQELKSNIEKYLTMGSLIGIKGKVTICNFNVEIVAEKITCSNFNNNN